MTKLMCISRATVLIVVKDYKLLLLIIKVAINKYKNIRGMRKEEPNSANWNNADSIVQRDFYVSKLCNKAD